MTRWIQLFFLVFAAEPLAAGSSLGVIDLQDAQQPFVLLEGEDAFDAAGRDVAAIGDFNGDGFGDVVIGAYRNNPDGISDAGAAYIVFGSAAGIPAELALADLDGSNGIRFFGRSATDNAGEFVAGIGDIDADGFDDVAIGAIRADPASGVGALSGAGEVYVVFGGAGPFPATLDPDSLSGANGFVIAGDDAFHELGAAIGGNGDVNGDGIDDLVIGAPGFDVFGESSRGAAFVIFGSDAAFDAELSVASLNGSNGFRIEGPENGSEAGRAVALLEDFDGDGLADIAVGVPEVDNASGTLSATGSAFIVFGETSPAPAVVLLEALVPADGLRIDGLESNDKLGRRLAAAGDLNDDGLADLAIGSLEHDDVGASNAGVVYVVFGADAILGPSFDLAGLDGVNGFELQGLDAGGRLGRSLDTAGDVNGDGIADLIASADLADPSGRVDAGESYIVFGSAAAMPPTLSVGALDGTLGLRIQGRTAGDRTGFSVGGGADFNGDGFDDVVLGAPESDVASETQVGVGYVVPGRPFDVLFKDGFEI